MLFFNFFIKSLGFLKERQYTNTVVAITQILHLTGRSPIRKKMKTLSINKSIVKVHSMFRGDAEKGQKRLTKKGIFNKVKNTEFTARLEHIPVNDLHPLLTQRETQETWVTNRLGDLDGFDMLACGALQVALDPNDKKYYVFDGCGRLAQAQENQAPAVLPCLVYDITKERAAFYFAYNQDKGRRTLSKEIIFVNAFYSGEKEALLWADRLTQIQCYIKGTTEYAVPHPQKAGHPEIKYRALTEGWKIANGDITLLKQARDMICQAWAGTDSGIDVMRQDLFLGLITFLSIYPEARKNGIHKALQNFLNWTASGIPQHKIQWKQDGKNQHNKEALSVVLGLTNAFRNSQFFKSQFGNVITLKKIKDYDQNFNIDTEEE